jgi:hypothetical protein
MTTASASTVRPSINSSFESIVAKKIKACLGSEPVIHDIRVRRVFDNKYRVNVFCLYGEQGFIPNVRITDSYFMTIDESGLILTCVVEPNSRPLKDLA